MFANLFLSTSAVVSSGNVDNLLRLPLVPFHNIYFQHDERHPASINFFLELERGENGIIIALYNKTHFCKAGN